MSRLVWDVGRADPRGSERLGEREGGVKVELKPRTGRTEGLGGLRGFLAFPGRLRTRGAGTGRSTARSTTRVLRTAQGTMVLRRVYGRAGVPTVVTPNGLYRPGSPRYVSGGLWAAVAPNGILKNRRGGSRGRRRRLFVDPRTFFGTNHKVQFRMELAS